MKANVTQRDIYNRLADIKRVVYKGQSPMYAFVTVLEKEGFWSRIAVSDENWVTAVLFVHLDLLAYLEISYFYKYIVTFFI